MIADLRPKTPEELEEIRLKIGPPKDVYERLEWALKSFEEADDTTRPLLRSNLQDATVPVLMERMRLRDKLDRQWAWFDTNPGHEEGEARYATYERTLAKYERAERLVERSREALKQCPS